MPTESVTGTVRAPAGFIGSLADTPLAEVLRRIVREERSGDLQVTTPEAIKTVYFDRGFIVFASSNLKSDRLGESLIEAGRISRQEFAAASMLMKSTRQKFGRVLVQSGILSEEELGHRVAAQVNRIVLSLFAARRGMYSFDERPTVIPIELMVSLSVYRILMEGIRRMTSKRLVLAGLPPLPTEVRVVDRPPFSFEVSHLTRIETEVLRIATEGSSLVRIVERIGGNEGVSLRACYGLISAGVLGFVSSATAARRPLRVQEETGTFVLSEIRRQVGERAPPPPAPSLPHEAPAEPAQPPESVEDVELESSSPPGSAGWLRRLWSALAAWWGGTGEPPPAVRFPKPPPLAGVRAPSPAPASPAEEPAAVFEAPGSTGGEERPPASSTKDESPVPEVATRAEAITPRWDAPDWSMAEDPSAQFRDFYEELGIASRDDTPPSPEPASEQGASATASSSDADRIVETESDGVPQIPSMLRHIPVETVAPVEPRVEHEIEVELEAGLLQTPEVAEPGLRPSDSSISSASSVSSVAPGEGDASAHAHAHEHRQVEAVESEIPENVPGAEREREMLRMKAGGGEQRLLRDVKLHFRLRDWEGAVPLLEQLVSISPGSALYRGMLARALSRHPVRRKDAEEHFVEALRMAPQDPEIHYWLGLYYKSFGLESRAATEFRTTLRIDPRHEGARTQLGAARKDDALGAVIKKIFG